MGMESYTPVGPTGPESTSEKGEKSPQEIFEEWKEQTTQKMGDKVPTAKLDYLFSKFQVDETGIKTKGNLEGYIMGYKSIISLPDNLTVKGNLDILFTKIKTFPNDIQIEGDLYCEERLNKKARKLKSEGKIKGGIFNRQVDTDRRIIHGTERWF